MEEKQNNIYLYPNVKSAKYYRLQIKRIKLQEYFSFSEYGSREKALQAAIDRRNFLLKMMSLQDQLGFRKIFKQNGKLIGLNLYRSARSQAVYMTLAIPDASGKLKRFCERRLTLANFDDVYHELTQILLDKNHIELDFEDKNKIKKAIRLQYFYQFKQMDSTFEEALSFAT